MPAGASKGSPRTGFRGKHQVVPTKAEQPYKNPELDISEEQLSLIPCLEVF